MSELFECEVSMSRPQALAVVDALSVVSDAAGKGAADPGAVQTFNDAFPDAEDRAETSETARFAMALFRAGVATIPETGTLFSRADTGPFSEVCAHARDDTSFGDDYALFFWADEDGSVDHGALFAQTLQAHFDLPAFGFVWKGTDADFVGGAVFCKPGQPAEILRPDAWLNEKYDACEREHAADSSSGPTGP